MISTYAEKKLQSSSNGVAFAVAGAMFLVIGASAFGSFVFGALGWGETDYGLDSGMVALMAFVLPGVYLLYRWRTTAARKALFKSYVFAIDEIEYPLIDLMALVGKIVGGNRSRSARADRCRTVPGSVYRSQACLVRALAGNGSAHAEESRGSSSNRHDRSGQRIRSNAGSEKIQARFDPDIRDLVVQCPQCGELNYRTADLETCEFCGAALKGLDNDR